MKPILGQQLIVGHPLNQKLIADWPMNEGCGSLVQDVSGNNSGVFVNSPTWVATQDGPSILCNNTANSRIAITNKTVPAIGTGPYTIIVSAMITNSNDCGLFTFGNFDPSWVWSQNDSGRIGIYDGGGYKTYSSTNLVLNKNHQFAWVRKTTGANDTYYYANGVAWGTATHADSINKPTTIILAGDRNSNGSELTGKLHYVMFWNRALSASEILELYTNNISRYEGGM